MKKTKNTYLALLAVLSLPMVANAGSISSFQGIYDTSTNRALFSFVINTVDADTPNGIDNMYLDFDEFQLWTAGWGFLDATTSNTTANFFDEDELIMGFDALTGSNVNVQFLFGNVNLTNFDTSSWSHDWGFNLTNVPTAFGENQFLLNTGHTQANWAAGSLGATLATVPEPGTLALLGLGLVGMAARRRKAA